MLRLQKKLRQLKVVKKVVRNKLITREEDMKRLFSKAWITKSFGFKRLITSFLLVLVGLAKTNPALIPYLPLIYQLLAALGITAVTHAAYKGTFNTLKGGSITGLFAVVMSIAYQTPALFPFIPVLDLIALALGGIGVGEALGKADVVANPMPTIDMAVKAQHISDPEKAASVTADVKQAIRKTKTEK